MFILLLKGILDIFSLFFQFLAKDLFLLLQFHLMLLL